MLLSTLSRNIDQNGLPDDIFKYNNQSFDDYIQQSYSNDFAGLLSFQAIRNRLYRVETSGDILLIFKWESEEINKRRQLCWFKISNDKCEIKLGIKLAIHSLIELLKIKQGEQKEKTLSECTSPTVATLKSVDQTQSQNEITAPPTIAALPVSNAESTQLAL